VLGPQSVNTVAPATEKSQTVHTRHTAPMQVADGSSSRSRNRCNECGVVESVREVETKGQGSGLGAVGGGVVGGLLGNQMGGGRGKDAMTVVGVVGGAMAGNEVEKRSKSTRSYAITIRLDNGSSRTINEANAPEWRAGDRVKVVNGAIQFNN
jgi:outer membrane lipoprotein SlyB